MSEEAQVRNSERAAVRQYAEWYSRKGYRVSVEPRSRELPDFLRGFAPDLIAQRDGENIVVEIKTSSKESSEGVQDLARALEHRAGWQLHVVYSDLADPEWEPPSELPSPAELAERLDTLSGDENDERQIFSLLLIWSVIEAIARHKLANAGIAPTRRISSSALIKMLLVEGIIEEDQYQILRHGLAVRNVIAHGFLNQTVDPALMKSLVEQARSLLASGQER